MNCEPSGILSHFILQFENILRELIPGNVIIIVFFFFWRWLLPSTRWLFLLLFSSLLILRLWLLFDLHGHTFSFLWLLTLLVIFVINLFLALFLLLDFCIFEYNLRSVGRFSRGQLFFFQVLACLSLTRFSGIMSARLILLEWICHLLGIDSACALYSILFRIGYLLACFVLTHIIKIIENEFYQNKKYFKNDLKELFLQL